MPFIRQHVASLQPSTSKRVSRYVVRLVDRGFVLISRCEVCAYGNKGAGDSSLGLDIPSALGRLFPSIKPWGFMDNPWRLVETTQLAAGVIGARDSGDVGDGAALPDTVGVFQWRL